MGVRPRQPEDLPVLLALLQRTHEQEGYPVRAEAVSDWWLADPDELGAWVVDDGAVRGHVALHPPRGTALPLWHDHLGTEELALVSRFFTDRAVRGTGSALLQHAVADAGRRGLTAVLEVDVLSPALGFYLRRGWRDAGRCVEQWGHRTVDVAALVQPAR